MNKKFINKINKIVEAWEKLRPSKTFFNINLDELKNQIEPSMKCRNEIDTQKISINSLMIQRDDNDKKVNTLILNIVNSVKGDIEEGEDGELYSAMGYVRKSDRKSGLTRKYNLNQQFASGSM